MRSMGMYEGVRGLGSWAVGFESLGCRVSILKYLGVIPALCRGCIGTDFQLYGLKDSGFRV